VKVSQHVKCLEQTSRLCTVEQNAGFWDKIIFVEKIIENYLNSFENM